MTTQTFMTPSTNNLSSSLSHSLSPSLSPSLALLFSNNLSRNLEIDKTRWKFLTDVEWGQSYETSSMKVIRNLLKILNGASLLRIILSIPFHNPTEFSFARYFLRKIKLCLIATKRVITPLIALPPDSMNAKIYFLRFFPGLKFQNIFH